MSASPLGLSLAQAEQREGSYKLKAKHPVKEAHTGRGLRGQALYSCILQIFIEYLVSATKAVEPDQVKSALGEADQTVPPKSMWLISTTQCLRAQGH